MGTSLNAIPADWGDNITAPEITPDTETITKTEAIAAPASMLPESVGGPLDASYILPEDTTTSPVANSANASDSTNDPAEKRITFGEYSMSIDEVYRDIKRLTLSKNPLDLIFKANEIREKFAFFINSLASFISKSFSFDDESFSYELYHDSEYHRVWIDLIYSFLRDARFISGDFDAVGYTVKRDDDTDEHRVVDLNDILTRSRANKLSDDDFGPIRALIQTVIATYRQTESVSARYADPIESPKTTKQTSFTPHALGELSRDRSREAIKKIDALIAGFPYSKMSFRGDVNAVFEEYSLPYYDVEELRVYIFRQIVERYYPDVCHIFFDANLPYGCDKSLLKKAEWLKLKGMQELTIDNIGVEKGEERYRAKNREYFRHVLNCKNLILDLESSILSPILLPIILKLIASSMTLDRKEFSKFSYILLFLFANSYENEYIPIARFLSELEVYINFDNARRAWERFKIWFSLIVLFILFVVLGYFLLPPFVFVGGVVLVGVYLKMYFIDDYTLSAGIQLNTGIRLWAVIILAVFGYTWLTNIGSYTTYYTSLQHRLEGFGSRIVAEIIPPQEIADGVKHGAASILEWQGQKK